MIKKSYINPFWWSLRLSGLSARILPDPWVMAWIGWSSQFGGEPELNHLACLVDPNGVVIDVGAADGIYAWHLKRLSRSCIAFECNPVQAELVRRRLPDIQLFEYALSSQSGTSQLRIPIEVMPLTGFGTLEPANGLSEFSNVQCLDVETRTLDSFGFLGVTFIKIDVEGHELEVLRGAHDTLLRDKPVLLIEIEERHRANALSSVDEYLTSLGYAPPEPSLSPQNYIFRYSA